MLLLKPGQIVNVQHIQKKISGKGTLLDVGETKLTLSMNSMVLEQGDEIEIQIPQQDDALYIIKGKLLGTEPGDCCILQVIGEPYHLQRRKSQRIPTRLKAEYILLSVRGQERDFQQGLILNISKAGALLYVEEPLDLSSELFLMFKAPLGKEKAFTTGISGKVVRKHHIQRNGKPGYGVEFDKPLAFLAG